MLNTKATILIVDDEPSIRLLLSQSLAEMGYNVRSAADGFSALREIRNELPQFLLSDLNMPGISGFELLAVVRRRFPAIRTIAMSGSFSGDEVPSGVAADAYFQKGCSILALLRIMESLPGMQRPTIHSAIEPVAGQMPMQAFQQRLVKGMMDEVAGSAKRKAGELTGNPKLQSDSASVSRNSNSRRRLWTDWREYRDRSTRASSLRAADLPRR